MLLSNAIGPQPFIIQSLPFAAFSIGVQAPTPGVPLVLTASHTPWILNPQAPSPILLAANPHLAIDVSMVGGPLMLAPFTGNPSQLWIIAQQFIVNRANPQLVIQALAPNNPVVLRPHDGNPGQFWRELPMAEVAAFIAQNAAVQGLGPHLHA